MKSLIVSLLASTVAAMELCGIKHPSAMNAIGTFCDKKDMVVPSVYTNAGAKGYHGDQNTHVWIVGNCVPPQWVPSSYCMSQFYAMCNLGETERKFGNGGCQTWHMSFVEPAPTKATTPVKATPEKTTTVTEKPPQRVTVHL